MAEAMTPTHNLERCSPAENLAPPVPRPLRVSVAGEIGVGWGGFIDKCRFSLESSPTECVLSGWTLFKRNFRYAFGPGDISRFSPFVWIPVLAWGLRIEHTRPDYPGRIVVFTIRRPSHLMAKLKQSGYRTAEWSEKVHD